MHNEYTRTSNFTGQTEDHVPWICLPQSELPTVHYRCTRRSSALPVLAVSVSVHLVYLWSSIPVLDH